MTRSCFEAFLRALLISLSLAGIIWSAVTLPGFWSAVPITQVGARILAGDRFKSEVLDEVRATMEASAVPIVQRGGLQFAEALIRLRIFEEAPGRKAPEEVDNDATVADDRLKSALALDPASSLLWLMLYSLEIQRNGFEDKVIGYLDQSYATGPLEAWIALRRNRLALAAFADLSPVVQMKVLAEFAGLVDSNFLEDAAMNLKGAGLPQRDRLLASLANTNPIPRQAFAKVLQQEGLKIDVPGVMIEERLWVR